MQLGGWTEGREGGWEGVRTERERDRQTDGPTDKWTDGRKGGGVKEEGRKYEGKG